MGLDQYAYIKHGDGADDDRAAQFVWRKHSKLQAWAEALFTAKTGQPAEKLNCGELLLEAADIADLEKLVKQKALPKSEGGFFFGHQFKMKLLMRTPRKTSNFVHGKRMRSPTGRPLSIRAGGDRYGRATHIQRYNPSYRRAER